MSQGFWQEIESLAASTVQPSAALLNAYVNKARRYARRAGRHHRDVGRIAGWSRQPACYSISIQRRPRPLPQRQPPRIFNG